MRTTTTATIVAGGAAVLVALTGCASSVSGSGAASGTQAAAVEQDGVTGSSSSSVSSSSSASGTASAGSPLSALVLQRGDVPSSYTQQAPARSDGSDRTYDDQLHRCLGVPSSSGARVESLTSASYGSTGAGGLASDIVRYRSQADVDAQVALLKSPKAKGCFSSLLAGSFTKGAKVYSQTVEVRPGTNDGPSNVGGVVSVDLTVDEDGRGSRQPISLALYYVTGPKLLAQVQAVGIGAPVDGDALTRAVDAVAGRVAEG